MKLIDSKNCKKIVSFFVFVSLFFSALPLPIDKAHADTLLTDDFTGTTINTSKWVETDTGGLGGTTGNIQQNGTLSASNGYSTNWSTNVLTSVDSFNSENLEISAKMTSGSEQILSFGDYNFDQTGKKAYLIDVQSGGNINSIVWNNGSIASNSFCGAATSGSTYKIKIVSGGFEVYKDDALQCTKSTAVVIDSGKVSLQSSDVASTFDDVLVVGSPMSAPGAPTSLYSVSGNTQITLSWVTPTSNGGSAVTDYVVEYKLSSEPTTWSTFSDGTSTSTTATVTGLTNLSSYDFRVKAVNAIGTGVASNTTTKTPGVYTAPNAPTIGTAFAGNTEATVTFTAPFDNGGLPITSYTVTSSPGNFTGTGAGSPVTVTGLTNGVEYTFTVTATNTAGTSSSSSASNSITPSVLGTQLIEDFSGTTINTTKWLEIDPTGKGGSAGKVLQNGTLSIADSSTSVWGNTALISQDSFSASSLEISVVMNSVSNPLFGYGDYVFNVSPNKAYLVYAQHGSNVLALSWENGGLSQTSCGTTTDGATYKMKVITGGFEVYKNNVLQCTHNTSVVIDNKPIFLQTSDTASIFDDVVVYGTKTTAVVPGQVTGLTSTGMNKQVLLNWEMPSSTGYRAVTNYIIEYKLSSSGSWSTFSDGLSQNTKTVVTGLTNDVAYDFRVSAVNTAGSGTPSSTSSATPSAINTMAFVFTGESNSGGTGLNSDATPQELAAHSSIQIMNLTSGDFLFENLQIGVNNLRDHFGLESSYTTSHGFELQLANSTEAHAFPDNEQVYLVKTGQGSSRVSQWDVGGTYWTKFLQRTSAAKTQLNADRKWIVWMSLGINDGNNATDLLTWKNAMVAHINKIKNDLPGAIIIMTQFQSMLNYSAYDAIMSDIADEEPNVYIISSTGASLLDSYHWSYAGLKTVTSRMITVTKDALGLNFPGKPTSLLTTPAETSMALSWTAPVSNGGAAIIDYTIEYKLSSEPTTWTTFNDGTSTSTTTTVTGLSSNTAYDFRVSALNTNGSGNTTSVSATTDTSDSTAPSISAVIATPDSTSSTITWTTNESSSSIVEYGLTDSYGTSTAETNTSPRVSDHTVVLPDLLACTTYHFRVKSKDSSLNLATGTDNNFTTTGCTGNAGVEGVSSDTITSLAGGTISLSSGTANLSLVVPIGFNAVSEAIFQIKQLNTATLLLTTGNPSNKTVVGSHTYNLLSLSGISTALTSFDQNLAITIHYTDSEVSGLDESTLLIYYWDGSNWNPLSGCSVNTSANTVSCTTNHFTTFAVFGSTTSTPVVSGGGGGGGRGSNCYNCKSRPMTPSGGFKMIINSGESTTAMRTVNLSFNAGLDIKKIAISSKSDFSDSNQEDYSPTKTFDLCSKFAGSVKSPSCPDGEYTVYAKFYTQYGQSSDPVSAKINLKSNYRATQISSFTKSLKVGSRDSQVKNLQEFLNKNGFKIAKSGAGSVGKETNYFGKLTSVALAKFQEANKDKVPGIMKEKGFLGPKTREFINSLNK